MAYNSKYEEDDRNHAPYHSDEYSDDFSDEDEDYEEDHEIKYLYDNDDDAVYLDDSIVRTEWKLLKLGEARLRISNEGHIQFLDISMFYISKGYRENGTPYRYINIEVFNRDMRQYYIHDLVWRAFNQEDPPHGWEVRHANHTPMDENHCYENRLQYLDIYQKTVCTEYKIEKI